MGVGDVAKDTAGADRGELLIISDQADTCTASDGELDGGVEGEGVGHAGFIDDQQGRPPNRCRPVGQVTVLQRPGEFGECVGCGCRSARQEQRLRQRTGRGRAPGHRLGSRPG